MNEYKHIRSVKVPGSTVPLDLKVKRELLKIIQTYYNKGSCWLVFKQLLCFLNPVGMVTVIMDNSLVISYYS